MTDFVYKTLLRTISHLCLEMGILLQHHDNENIFVATITTIGKIHSPENERPAINMSLKLKYGEFQA